MNEVKLSLSECLMQAWKAGWPEYCEDPKDDYPSLFKLSEKIAKQVNVNIETDEGINRVCRGISNIAHFCRSNVPWCYKNIYWAQLCFQTLYNHMKSAARMKNQKK